MNYEVERKLNEKVDKREFHALQSKNQQLENDVSKLERQVGELQSVNQSRYYVIERLIIMMAENETFTEHQNELYNIRNSL